MRWSGQACYAPLVRRLGILFSLLLLAGCRPSPIPPDLQTREYEVYHALLEDRFAGQSLEREVVVSPETVQLNEFRLQYKRCMPQRMQEMFEGLGPGRLSRAVGTDWLNIPGASLQLAMPETPIISHKTEYVRLSRVAFTRFGTDAYVWLERQTCGPPGGLRASCDAGSGTLVHGVSSGGQWSFDDTLCNTVFFQ